VVKDYLHRLQGADARRTAGGIYEHFRLHGQFRRAYVVNDLYKRYVRPMRRPGGSYGLATWSPWRYPVRASRSVLHQSVHNVTEWIVSALVRRLSRPRAQWHWCGFNGYRVLRLA